MAVLRIIGWGCAAGAAAASLVAVTDLIYGAHGATGLLTLFIGVAAGGLLLILALGMALTSAWLAGRQKAPSIRRRMLTAAVWSGAAGLACGFSAVLLWLAAGRPLHS